MPIFVLLLLNQSLNTEKMIDIRHYIYFIAVAETGSFSLAAEKCCLT